MKKRSAEAMIRRLADRVLTATIGPETEGIIQYVLVDKIDPELLHVLVITSDGEEKHLMFMAEDRGRFPFSNLTPGSPIDIRTRGTGMFLMPWVKAERDPFNLAPDKKKKKKNIR